MNEIKQYSHKMQKLSHWLLSKMGDMMGMRKVVAGLANDAACNFRILVPIPFYRYLENITLDPTNNKTNIKTFVYACPQNNKQSENIKMNHDFAILPRNSFQKRMLRFSDLYSLSLAYFVLEVSIYFKWHKRLYMTLL